LGIFLDGQAPAAYSQGTSLAEKRILKEKGRVVNQKKHNELRGFSTAPLFVVSPIDFESKMGVDKKIQFFLFSTVFAVDKLRVMQ
jgi:hypothetical protein